MGHIDTQALIAHLRSQLLVNWHGHHGISHWARVRVNGLMLARETGANPHVVELFAWFHDSKRVYEHEDIGHGSRGAIWRKSCEVSIFMRPTMRWTCLCMHVVITVMASLKVM